MILGGTMDSFEILSIELYQFISTYIPKGWKESIGRVDYVPRFTNEEVENIWSSYKNAEIYESIKNYSWYIQEAILQFFDHVKCTKVTRNLIEWEIQL
jgi:hypothetical protein